MASSLNLRQRQADALLRLLNLSGSTTAPTDISAAAADTEYKVLVLDRFCRDVVAPLLRVHALRRAGVTLHLALEASDRQPIPDVPAVYLSRPTPEAVERVVQDAAAGLYDSVYLCWATALPPPLMERLAAGAVRAGAAARIARVTDAYLAFVALEAGLFTLALPDAYVALHDPAAREAQIAGTVAAVVDGLFSVLVTLGCVPVIRAPRGGAAEHVAQLLDARLRDHLKARHNLFSEEGGVGGGAGGAGPHHHHHPAASSGLLSRPLLVLLDRNFDLGVMVQHSWSYKPLVHDVLGMRSNRVTLAPEQPSAAAGADPATAAAAATPAANKPRSYDVDDSDFFWEQCGSLPFPRVAEEVEAQLQRYKRAVDDINARTAAGGAAGAGGGAAGAFSRSEVLDDPDEALRRNAQQLMSAVSSLPELQERKRVLDKHTNLATALLTAIKSGGLDQMHGLEEDLLAGKAGDAAKEVGRAVKAPKGSPADKLRLALVHALSAPGPLPEPELRDLSDALRGCGADPTALAYVARLRRNGLIGGGGAGGGGGLGGAGGSAANLAGGGGEGGALLGWADKAIGQGLSSVTKSVRSLLSGARQAPIVSVLDALMDPKPTGGAGGGGGLGGGGLGVGVGGGSSGQQPNEHDTFLVFDPKLPPGRAGPDRARGPFRDAIVFVVGGGNYLEREQLATWAAGGAGAAGAGAGGGGGGAGAAGGLGAGKLGGAAAGARTILYGATSLPGGSEFVAQLEELGRRSGIVGGAGGSGVAGAAGAAAPAGGGIL
jgi:hypothetical protein